MFIFHFFYIVKPIFISCLNLYLDATEVKNQTPQFLFEYPKIWKRKCYFKWIMPLGTIGFQSLIKCIMKVIPSR